MRVEIWEKFSKKMPHLGRRNDRRVIDYIAVSDYGQYSGREFLEWTSSKKVLEKLATSEKTTIVISRDHDGKMYVTSCSWDSERVFPRDPERDVRTAPRRRCVACKPRQPDKGGSADHAPRQTKLASGNRFHPDTRLEAVIDYVFPAPAVA
jgi:hypothetical protein